MFGTDTPTALLVISKTTHKQVVIYLGYATLSSNEEAEVNAIAAVKGNYTMLIEVVDMSSNDGVGKVRFWDILNAVSEA